MAGRVYETLNCSKEPSSSVWLLLFGMFLVATGFRKCWHGRKPWKSKGSTELWNFLNKCSLQGCFEDNVPKQWMSTNTHGGLLALSIVRSSLVQEKKTALPTLALS